MARSFKEDDFQMNVAKYLDAINFLWCHVANERKTSKQAGLRLKNKGVKPGVPDCIIFEPNSKYAGLFIELKIKPNKPTENQLIWLRKLQKKGYYTCICYNIDEVIGVVEKYMSELK